MATLSRRVSQGVCPRWRGNLLPVGQSVKPAVCGLRTSTSLPACAKRSDGIGSGPSPGQWPGQGPQLLSGAGGAAAQDTPHHPKGQWSRAMGNLAAAALMASCLGTSATAWAVEAPVLSPTNPGVARSSQTLGSDWFTQALPQQLFNTTILLFDRARPLSC
jgi:hypothetical protein